MKLIKPLAIAATILIISNIVLFAFGLIGQFLFWVVIIAMAILAYFGIPYFFWPFSGAITAGIMWTIIEILNSMDKEQNINVFIDNGKEEE